MLKGYLFSVGVLASCSAATPEVPNEIVLGVAIKTADAGRVTIAYTDETHQTDLPSIAEGAIPTGFAWATISIRDVDAVAMTSDAGLAIADLREANRQLSFSQVYPGPCNPALNDFSTCWLLESYTSGMEGFTGRLTLRESNAVISGSFDIDWVGLTDRFGEPIQQHQHTTSAIFNVAVRVSP